MRRPDEALKIESVRHVRTCIVRDNQNIIILEIRTADAVHHFSMTANDLRGLAKQMTADAMLLEANIGKA